ncbi:MAG: hypothetical protein JW841_02635 [Deltaproteobacteria bacterium]|nr:hypothetical protein [Deltaproteobacteria bacterium]
MRTTIDISDEQRSKLLEIAGRRGEKGFSSIVKEALTLYLRDQQKNEAIALAIKLRGQLPETEAEELENYCKIIRKFWR